MKVGDCMSKKELLEVLKKRFSENKNRHSNIEFNDVLKKLESASESIINSLIMMEETGGMPDVVFYDKDKNEYHFMDCSSESPIGRRSFCYDNEALESRKVNKPVNSAVEMAKKMGVSLLNEKEYRYLQTLGDFDLKTSSWIKTPENIRKLGGALFCDKRYDTVFLYHNGAESYYGARGFRTLLII